MATSEWLVCTTPEHALGVADVVRAHDPGARMRLVNDGRALRNQLRSAPGVVSVAVGYVDGPVSDVNLAAALAKDGCARTVMLVRDSVSGSLKSRARQAGIGVVAQAADDGPQLFPFGEMGGAADGDSIVPLVRPAPFPPAADEFALSGPLEEPEPTPALASVPAPLPAGEMRSRHVTARLAPVVTFCSGRGGVGKSTLAGLAALAAASWGMRVVVVDLDLTSGNLRGMLGSSASAHVLGVEAGDLVPNVGEILGAADAFGAGPVLFGPCERPEQAEEVIPRVQRLLEVAADGCDLVLVDTPSTVTDAVAAAMQLSERVLLVSDDMPGGLASLARVSGLAVRLGVARTRIMRVENRGDPREDVNLSAGRAEVGLEVARVLRAFEGGYAVAELAAEGRLAEVGKESRELSASVGALLAQVLSELGCLPDVPAAKEALKGAAPKRRRLFGSKREAS